ncbi:MAG: alpha/beta hydrolase [Spirochaetaceae bacterium]|nr:MAG: alpha/beta hydrolase [Spirochaetaceae bacterium]
MATKKTEQPIKLKYGRTLAYAEYGNPEGKPILEFHGNPSSRLGSELFDEAAKEMGIRVIGIDRPGMGFSDYRNGRNLPDWPEDLLELVEALAIERFPMVGGSEGLPSVLMCKYKISEQLSAFDVLIGPTNPDSPGRQDGWISLPPNNVEDILGALVR